METVVLVIHLIVAIAIIALVLLQRSEGGGLGIGGGGMGNFASARGTANALTRMTAICAAIFFATSLTLGVMASRGQVKDKGILEKVDIKDVEIPAPQAPVEGAGGITYVPPEELPSQEGAAPDDAVPAPVEEKTSQDSSAPQQTAPEDKDASKAETEVQKDSANPVPAPKP